VPVVAFRCNFRHPWHPLNVWQAVVSLDVLAELIAQAGD
jgi:hypothetical protein